MSKYDTWALIIEYLDDSDINNLIRTSKFFIFLIRNECTMCGICNKNVFEEMCDSLLMCGKCFVKYSRSFSAEAYGNDAINDKIGFELKYNGSTINIFEGRLKCIDEWKDSSISKENLYNDLQNYFNNFTKNLKAIQNHNSWEIDICTELDTSEGSFVISTKDCGIIEFFNNGEMVLDIPFGRVKHTLKDIFEYLLDVCIYLHSQMFFDIEKTLQ